MHTTSHANNRSRFPFLRTSAIVAATAATAAIYIPWRAPHTRSRSLAFFLLSACLLHITHQWLAFAILFLAEFRAADGCGGNTAAAHLAGTAIDEPAPPPPIVTQVRCARVSSLLGMCYRECVVVVRRWSTASSIVPLTLSSSSSSSSSSSWVYGTRSSRLRRSVHGMARVCAVCRRVCMAATLPVDST